MQTEIGRIAAELSKSQQTKGKKNSTSNQTQLEKMLAYLSFALLGVVILLAFIVFAANSFVFSKEVASYALSVVIAVLPEGLTAVVSAYFLHSLDYDLDYNYYGTWSP
jgi:magnesium-transporting ATPase (P-type)